VLALALRQNPDVVAARLAVDSARAEQGIARALPNPVYSVIPGTPFKQSVAATLDLVTPTNLSHPGRGTRHDGDQARPGGRDEAGDLSRPPGVL